MPISIVVGFIIFQDLFLLPEGCTTCKIHRNLVCHYVKRARAGCAFLPFPSQPYIFLATCYSKKLLQSRVLGLDDLQKSLPTSAILWFCDICGIYISSSTRKKIIVCYDWKLFATSFFEVTFGTCKSGKNLGHSNCIQSTITVKEKYEPLCYWCHSGRFFIVTSRRGFVQQELNKFFTSYEIS